MDTPITPSNISNDIDKEKTSPLQDSQGKEKKKGKFSPIKFIIRILSGDFIFERISKEGFAAIFLATVLGVFYINNRYNAQQQLLEINKLRIELQDVKYNALTKQAILLHKSRQSKIEEELKKQGSKLEIPSNPPFLIKD